MPVIKDITTAHQHWEYEPTTKPIIGPETYSPEWYALRKFDPDRERPVVFGASEAAAACGRSKYSSALDLYLIKRGEIEDSFSEDQIEAMEMGHHLEPIILDRYEKRTGLALTRKLPMFLSADHLFMGATPDGLPRSQNIGEWDRAVDAKTSTTRMIDKTGSDVSMWGDDGTDQVPLDYLFQAQQQCAVLGVQFVDFPVMFDARTIRIYTVKRDEELIAEIVAAEKELAERIINGDPPEPDFQHSGTLKLLKKTQGYEAGKVITWDDSLAEKWRQLADVKEQLKALEKKKDVLDAELFHAMGDAEQAVCGPLTVKRIHVKATSFVTDKKAYSYLKASKAAR
jgi:predicted phage-related endonuclease